jgi:hypothetical protein
LNKFVPDIELTEWVVRLFVRQEHGRELVQEGEAVKGFGDERESRGYRRLSESTYLKHSELPQHVYDLVQTLSSQKAKVVATLTQAGVDSILADDGDTYHRTPRWLSQHIREAYKRIAYLYQIGIWERKIEEKKSA